MARKYIGLLISPEHKALREHVARHLASQGVKIPWSMIGTGTELLRGLQTKSLVGLLGISPNYAEENLAQQVADLLDEAGIATMEERDALTEGVAPRALVVEIQGIDSVFEAVMRKRRINVRPRQALPLLQRARNLLSNDSGELIAHTEARRNRPVAMHVHDAGLSEFLQAKAQRRDIQRWLAVTNRTDLIQASMGRGEVAGIVDVHICQEDGPSLGEPHVLQFGTEGIVEALQGVIADLREMRSKKPPRVAPAGTQVLSAEDLIAMTVPAEPVKKRAEPPPFDPARIRAGA